MPADYSPAPVVTDAMVAAALQAWFKVPASPVARFRPEHALEMKQALEAALRTLRAAETAE
jgi:hypothetical protein